MIAFFRVDPEHDILEHFQQHVRYLFDLDRFGLVWRELAVEANIFDRILRTQTIVEFDNFNNDAVNVDLLFL